MSYDIYLKEPNGNICQVERHEEGGISRFDTNACLYITCIYDRYFYENIDKQQGIMMLCNKKVKDCIPLLEEAIEKLGTEKSDYYWASTAGNAGYALSILLNWAKENPNAVFGGKCFGVE